MQNFLLWWDSGMQEEGKVRWFFDGKVISGMNIGHLLLLLEIKLSERLHRLWLFLMEIHFFNLKSYASEILLSLMIAAGNQFGITDSEINPMDCLSPLIAVPIWQLTQLRLCLYLESSWYFHCHLINRAGEFAVKIELRETCWHQINIDISLLIVFDFQRLWRI